MSLDLSIGLMTPMYGGGPEAGHFDIITPFRPSSIRGHLRFWWRATQGASYDDWKSLRRREAEIWGDTDQQSPVRIRVDCPSEQRLKRKSLREFDDPGFRYALFPPYNEKRVNLDDPRFLVGGGFHLKVLLAADAIHLGSDVEAALWAWLTFGGIGARTRRGAGSLFCAEYSAWRQDYITGDGRTRDWPTLRGATLVRGAATTWDQAWSKMLHLYRTFRQDRDDRRHTRWPEPDEIRAIRKWGEDCSDEGFPRSALGLPIVFHFKDHGEPPDQTLSIQNAEGGPGRMASRVILRPFGLSAERAQPSLLVLNSPDAKTLSLFQGTRSDNRRDVKAGRRDAIRELVGRASHEWSAAVQQL